ncbi:hypothetical protein C0J52_21119 [Blattella germanica]|nr:hypothetical protein C0J52_21119 [Blattella germanica]
MRYVAEDVEGERHGEPHQEWDSLSTRIRRMRRQSKGQTQTPPRPFGPGGAGPLPVDRKDALTKKPLDFDQEEETRKAETSKWLEHHFGSDSRSSKDSMDDEEEAAPVGGSSTSYINVTMKSRPISASRIVNNGGHAPLQPKAYTATVNTSSRVFVASPEPEGAASGFFQGVSDWAERRTTRVQVLSPTTANNNFLTTERAAYGNYGNGNGRAVSRDSPPNMERASSPYHQRASPYHNGDVENGGEDHHQSPQPPFRRRHHERHEEEREGSTLPRRHKKAAAAEPPPDYSPPTHRATPSPSPPPEAAPTNKKLYQRTRFAADIPPPPARQQRAKSPGQSATSIIGESFRKLVGKFRSPSPKSSSSTYQQYHVIDGHIPSVPNKASAAARVGRRGGEEEESAAQAQATPVAPPRSSRPGMDHRSYQQRRGASPVVQRFYLGEDPFGGSIYGREREANVSSSTLGRLSKSTSRLVNGAPDSSLSRGAQTLPRKLYDERVKNQVYIQRTTEGHHWDSSRLNRINKSQPHSNSMINVSIINNVTPPTSSIGVNKPLSNGGLGPAKPARTYRSNLSRSKSFNVHAGSPDAPEASSLLLGSRSRDTSTVYKSNPHLHRLDESPPPLKSPGILASISRSQRDLTASLDKEEDKDDHHRFSKSTSNLIGNGYTSSSSHEAKKKLFMKGLMDRAPELYKTLHGDELPDAKPLSPSPVGRIYSSTPLKNGTTSNLSSSRILDYSSSFRSSSTNNTPENDSLRGRPLSSPYRPPMINGTDRVTSPVGNKSNFTSTLTHTPSFRDTNGTTTSIVRRGSIADDDYSETVRITSKSDDPIRPSVTNTVQSYSKKTVPKKGGHSRETIESSETTTVTKSRYRPESNHYSLRNGGGGGVVIEVRPSRK